jgi:zinc protease
MKRIVTVIFLSLAMAVAVSAQEAKPKMEAKPAEAMPTADQIIEKYVQALGGKAAIEKLNSRASKSSFDIPAMGASGTVEAYEKAPNKSLAIITIPGFGVIREAYDGKMAWAEDPTMGMREKSGIELADTRLEAEFHKPIKLKQLFPTMTVKSKEKVGEQEAYVIEAKPTEGSVEKWYFDTQTGLLIRQDAERETPQGKMPTETYLSDYKEVDGVKIPHSVRVSNPTFVINIKTEEIKHNVPVDDAKFTKPAATK